MRASRPTEAPFALPAPGDAAARRLPLRGLAHMLRMGHCAPTVLQTLLEAAGHVEQWPVRLAAGLPGGIGNLGGECGGVTASLVALGLQHGGEPTLQGVPVVVHKGHELLQRFVQSEGSLQCRDIRGQARVPLRCIGVMRQAPLWCVQINQGSAAAALGEEQRQAYAELQAHWAGQGFHCAHAVLNSLQPQLAVDDQVLKASSAFLGGTVFSGMTCSALTAGVMALGLARGEIEDSRPRVLRMIATMALGGDAFDDSTNAFNKTMNAGHRLAQWFARLFGSTRCRALTACDFAHRADVRRYIECDGTARCQRLARQVADQVRAQLPP
jgi:C_GCAxxG_C_C family probable redox protein